jgi:hypothetical protein
MGAIDFGHHPIGQHNGKKMSIEMFQGLYAVGGGGHNEPCFFEMFFDNGSGNDVVVNNEYGEIFHHLLWNA